MKIFGTIFPFVESGDPDFRMGRYIANYEFLAALLNHASFDSYHLFCMTPGHLQSTAQRLTQDTSIDTRAKARIQLFLYSSLREKLETERYHVFHLGGWGYFFSGLAQLRNRYATHPFPITAIIHSLNARDARYDYHKLLTGPFTDCDAVICTSEAGREVMRKQLNRIAALDQCPPWRGQLPIIPLGVFPTRLPERQTCRRDLALNDNTVTILYIGRLSPNTKADLYPLMLCFRQLQQQSSQPLRLVIAGGASTTEQALHRDMIRELELEPAVTLLANFDPAMKWRLYAAADICIAPADNLQETFGISIIEAMQAGLPVVASDLNGYRDLVDNGSTGYLIPTTWIDQLELAEMDEIMSSTSLQTLLAQSMVVDLDQMRERLLALVEDPELRRRMGTNGRQKVAQQYLWPIVIARYEALWEQLHDQSRHADFTAQAQSRFSNNYLESFSHYPSKRLEGNIPVGLTDSGRQCLSSGQTPPIYNDVAMLLDQEWLAAVMRELDAEGEPITAAELLSRHGDEGNRGRFSLLWAAKYGLLKLG